jgi:sphingolipid C9-methyltransferase
MSLTQSHINSFLIDLMSRMWKHDSDADKADVSDVYNRGNDWYGWFLDEKMLYYMGYWDDSEEKDLQKKCFVAQEKKLNMICKDMLDLKEGEEHLDFGCGWGALVNMATRKYGAKSTGITLSQE